VQTLAQVIKKSGKKVAFLLGNRVLREAGLRAASQIAEKTGAKLFCEVFPTRLERGAGLPPVERIAYLAELASVQLNGYEHLVLVDAKAPVSFFAYPGKKSYLVPDDCTAHTLVQPHEDAAASLQALVEAVGASDTAPKLQSAGRPELPKGKLNAAKACQAIGALLPANAIISDEAQTSGIKLSTCTAGAPRHDVLTLTGGAIGQGLPVALGAATASPDRPVLALVGDGSAMYTIQALWTIAREGLDVTTVIFNNRSYGILNIELERVGAETIGPEARAQLDLSEPAIDFVSMAQGMGVPARRVARAEDFSAALKNAFESRGPFLIDAIVPSEYKGLKLKALPHMLSALGSVPSPLAKAIKKKIAP
jgi:acetolactate synthase-1/2/3 large subunit